MGYKIPLYKIYWDEEDVNNTVAAIKEGMFWAIGPNIGKFEKMVADYAGVEYAVALNSGTSALHAILLAYEIGQGDEVIVPSFTFVATANSALFTGAKPVFADIEEETYGLDTEDVKERITGKTKAIMPIHYGGLPCKASELKEIAEDHDLLLIEDAAESIGASIHGKKAGSFGNAAMFSFCGNKVITTGEGGMIVTGSQEACERLRLIRSHGRLDAGNYFASSRSMEYVVLGFNWRMSNITAALGVSQMTKLDKLIRMRRSNAEYLTEELANVHGLKTPSAPSGYYHIYQMFTVRAEKRDALKNYLDGKGIMTKIYFEPVHLTDFYRKAFNYKEGELPVTENLARQVLTLPMYPTLSQEDMDFVAKSITEFYDGL